MTQREKRFVTYGGIIVILLIGYFFGYRGYSDFTMTRRQAIEEDISRLSRYRAMARKKDALEKQVEYQKKRLSEVEDGLFTGDSPGLAAAEMQKLVNKIALDSDIELKTIKPLTEVEAVNFIELPLQINFRNSMEKVLDFLYEVETSETFLLISDLTIRVINEKDPETVDVRVKLSGFMKGGGSTDQS